MNILLEAYLDRNFGDDLFVTLLINHYKEHQFYLMDNDGRGFSLVNCSKYGNLHTLTEEDALAQIENIVFIFLLEVIFTHPITADMGDVWSGRQVFTKTGAMFWSLVQVCIRITRKIL